jgi:K+-sensing histidine kinase KdpD
MQQKTLAGFTWSSRLAARLRPYGAALLFTLAATGVSELLYRVFDTTRLSMVFLAGVLITAVTQGAYPGYFAAVLAFAIYNVYLVEPRFTFTFASPEDVLVLAVFLGVAMLTGGLAGRLRDESQRNLIRARATGALFEASRQLSSADDEEAIRQLVVEQMAAAAKGEAAMVDGSMVWRSSRQDDPLVAPPPELNLGEPGWRVRALVADGTALGVAAWRSAEGAPDPDSERLIQVLADLGAAAVLRARLSVGRSEIAAAARTEQLRNALLSSISHDLRTPLAAILASASSLKTFGAKFAPDVRDDLVTTIEEEAERLNRFVANLLSMTKLESGALALESQAFAPAEVANRAADRLDRLGSAVTRNLDGAAMIEGDPILLDQALGNILENAARYGQGGPILVSVRELGAVVLIEVADEGPGVPEADLERIFEKFYRSPRSAGSSQGTGLGLSIARGLIEAMGGSIQASGRSDGDSGLVVSMIFPRTLAA